MEEWKEAVERSKIPRINWKRLLGRTMHKYVLDKRKEGYKKDDIIFFILKECREKPGEWIGWDFADVVKNVKIGVSTRLAEQSIYKV